MKKKNKSSDDIVSVTFKHPSGLEGVMAAKVVEDNTFGLGLQVNSEEPIAAKKGNGNEIKSSTWNRN